MKEEVDSSAQYTFIMSFEMLSWVIVPQRISEIPQFYKIFNAYCKCIIEGAIDQNTQLSSVVTLNFVGLHDGWPASAGWNWLISGRQRLTKTKHFPDAC